MSDEQKKMFKAAAGCIVMIFGLIVTLAEIIMVVQLGLALMNKQYAEAQMWALVLTLVSVWCIQATQRKALKTS